MSDQHQELVLRVIELRRMVDEATLGPWRSLESKDQWVLQGEARQFKGKLKEGTSPSIQILRIPKRGTPYAEYYPNAADGALMVTAVNSLPFFLDWAEDVLTRHFPTVCGCRPSHFLCAANRAYAWEECPEVRAVTRALERLSHLTS